jgi:hypothetical protein
LNLSAVIAGRKNKLESSSKAKKFSLLCKQSRLTKRKFKSNENLSTSLTGNLVKNGYSSRENQHKFYQNFKKPFPEKGKKGRKYAKLSNTFDKITLKNSISGSKVLNLVSQIKRESLDLRDSSLGASLNDRIKSKADVQKGKFSSAKKLNMHLKSLRKKFDLRHETSIQRKDSQYIGHAHKGKYSGSFAIGNKFNSPEIESKKTRDSNSFTAFKKSKTSQSPNLRKKFKQNHLNLLKNTMVGNYKHLKTFKTSIDQHFPRNSANKAIRY